MRTRTKPDGESIVPECEISDEMAGWGKSAYAIADRNPANQGYTRPLICSRSALAKVRPMIRVIERYNYLPTCEALSEEVDEFDHLCPVK